MDLKGILSISGYPGLFKMIKQARNSIIVESLKDKKRMPAYATSKISALEDIAIFTETGDAKLLDVFKNIYRKEDGEKAISHKSKADELKAYFAEVLPEYDRDRVYVSDIKRIINWYNILQEHGMVDLDDEAQEENTENNQESTNPEQNQDENSSDKEKNN